MHTHIVFFWLTEPDNEAHRDTFAAGLSHLVQDKNVVSHKIGIPAQTNRDVVDSGYDFAITVEFETLATHNAYQAGQNHTDFLEQCQALWSRVQVYDVET